MPVAAPTKSAIAAADDSLSPRNMARLGAHILATSGIKTPPSKASMLAGRLRRRVRALKMGSLAEYCEWLFSDDNLAIESDYLINAVTTNKTDFFREPHHFEYLVDEILPAFVAAGTRRIRAWSAACSMGAEPYTIAMLLDAFARDARGPNFGILATDLDTDVLDAARRGVFPAELIAPVPKALRDRYVLPSRHPGNTDVRIVPALRAAIGFARLNLMDDHYPVDEMDLIFCRNVLIYFERATQEKVLRRLIDRLAPDGYLFLGHSESIAQFDLPIVPVAYTIFRRT